MILVNFPTGIGESFCSTFWNQLCFNVLRNGSSMNLNKGLGDCGAQSIFAVTGHEAFGKWIRMSKSGISCTANVSLRVVLKTIGPLRLGGSQDHPSRE